MYCSGLESLQDKQTCWFGKPNRILEMECELRGVVHAEVAGELHQQLHGVLVVVAQQQVPQRHQQRHHQLVAQRGRAAVR